MKRQLDDYYDKFYIKQAKRFKEISANDNQLAKEIALWKETVAERWDSIRVVSRTEDAYIGVETGATKTTKKAPAKKSTAKKKNWKSGKGTPIEK